MLVALENNLPRKYLNYDQENISTKFRNILYEHADNKIAEYRTSAEVGKLRGNTIYQRPQIDSAPKKRAIDSRAIYVILTVIATIIAAAILSIFGLQ